MKRSNLSRPARFLKSSGLLQGNLLDYGCGHGDDAEALGADKYDPHYFPKKPRRKYDTITCFYVLNTLPNKKERIAVIDNVRRLLKKNGTAYFAIRANREELTGWTSKGTWQGYVPKELQLAGVPVCINKEYEIYAIK